MGKVNRSMQVKTLKAKRQASEYGMERRMARDSGKTLFRLITAKPGTETPIREAAHLTIAAVHW